MRSSELARAVWRKSSRSNDGANADCVEVAELPGRIALRDSMDPGGHPQAGFNVAGVGVAVRQVRASPVSAQQLGRIRCRVRGRVGNESPVVIRHSPRNSCDFVARSLGVGAKSHRQAGP